MSSQGSGVFKCSTTLDFKVNEAMFVVNVKLNGEHILYSPFSIDFRSSVGYNKSDSFNSSTSDEPIKTPRDSEIVAAESILVQMSKAEVKLHLIIPLICAYGLFFDPRFIYFVLCSTPALLCYLHSIFFIFLRLFEPANNMNEHCRLLGDAQQKCLKKKDERSKMKESNVVEREPSKEQAGALRCATPMKFSRWCVTVDR